MNGGGTAFVVLAALSWGVSGGIGGILLASDWDPCVVSFYRGLIGLLFVCAWLVLRPQGHGLSNHRLWFWSTVAGLGVAGNFAFYFLSIAEGSVAVAVTLMYSAPVFVYLASVLLKLERPSALKFAAILMVLLGVVLLTRLHDLGAPAVTPLGVASGLLSGLSYAVFIFGFKNAGRYGSPQAILVIAFAVLVAVLIWPADTDQISAVLSAPSWPLFAVLGVLGAGVSFLLYIIGLKQTTPSVAAIVAMIEPVTASLFGVLVLHEKLADLQVVGMMLILATITVQSVTSRHRRVS